MQSSSSTASTSGGSVGDASAAAKYDAFVKWLLDNGARFPGLELREYEAEVRGVHAKEELEGDQVVVEIPLKCLITVEMGKGTEIGKAVVASDLPLDAPKHIFLMLFVLTDRHNPTSFFKPYYDILPSSLSNMPIFWTQNELAYLQGSYLLTQIDERKRAIEADYAAIADVAPSLPSVCSVEDFKWARMCVCSRNFGLEVNRVRTAALVPYADMLNHYRPRETKWAFDNGRQAFTITTLQRIAPGAQVFDSYGQKCNHRFLLNYGFAVENNREADGFCPNEVPLDFALRETDPLYSRKLPCWSRDGQSKVKRLRLCVADNENMRAAFSLLRVMVANEEELVRMLGPGNMFKTARDITYPVSLRNEERVLQTLLAKLTDALSAYPTRLEDDQAALACQDDPSLRPFSNRRHALIQVRGEKEVLSAFRALCATALTLLEVSDAVFKEAVNGLYSESNFFTANYCSDILYRLRQEEQRRLGAAAAQRAERVNLSKPTIV